MSWRILTGSAGGLTPDNLPAEARSRKRKRSAFDCRTARSIAQTINEQGHHPPRLRGIAAYLPPSIEQVLLRPRPVAERAAA